MALDQFVASLKGVKDIKQSLKENFNAAGVSTENIEFRQYGELVKEMEKILPSQTKEVEPSDVAQSVVADEGYKLTDVVIKPISSDYVKLTENTTYSGDTGAVFPEFEDAEFFELGEICSEITSNNMTSEEIEFKYGWEAGNTKDITLKNGEQATLIMLGFSHDNLVGGGKAGATFGLVNCLNTKYKFNDEHSTVGGWAKSDIRNTYLAEIRNLLPDELLAVIKKVNKLSVNGGSDLSFSRVETTQDDLFVLSAVEMLGLDVPSIVKEASQEGSQYEYYAKNNTANARAKTVNGVKSSYMLRSLETDCDYHIVGIDPYGEIQSTYVANDDYGVAIAFCI